jgi:hypothetical protein
MFCGVRQLQAFRRNLIPITPYFAQPALKPLFSTPPRIVYPMTPPASGRKRSLADDAEIHDERPRQRPYKWDQEFLTGLEEQRAFERWNSLQIYIARALDAICGDMSHITSKTLCDLAENNIADVIRSSIGTNGFIDDKVVNGIMSSGDDSAQSTQRLTKLKKLVEIGNEALS